MRAIKLKTPRPGETHHILMTPKEAIDLYNCEVDSIERLGNLLRSTGIMKETDDDKLAD